MDLLDINAYTPDWPFRPLRHRTAADLLRLMDASGIARAVISPLGAAFRLDPSAPNAGLLEFISPHRDRLAPAFAINPACPDWERDVQAARAHAAAIRLYPNYHGCAPADPDCTRLAQTAADAGLPLLIAARLQDERSHHPMMKVPPVPADQLAQLAAAVPHADLVITMLRTHELEPLLGAPNLHFDLSGMQGPVGFLPRLLGAVGPQRLLLGTALPLQYPLPSVHKLLAAPSPEIRQAIGFSNAMRLLPRAWPS